MVVRTKYVCGWPVEPEQEHTRNIELAFLSIFWIFEPHVLNFWLLLIRVLYQNTPTPMCRSWYWSGGSFDDLCGGIDERHWAHSTKFQHIKVKTRLLKLLLVKISLKLKMIIIKVIAYKNRVLNPNFQPSSFAMTDLVARWKLRPYWPPSITTKFSYCYQISHSTARRLKVWIQNPIFMCYNFYYYHFYFQRNCY